MKLQIMSDLHREFERPGAEFYPPKTDADVLVLAGDIDVGLNATALTDWALDNYPSGAFYIPGNHEAYGHTIEDIYGAIGVPKIQYVNDVVIIGASLWTDFSEKSERAMFAAKAGMNDYHRIKVRPQGPYGLQSPKFQPEDAYNMHVEHRDFIEKHLLKAKEEGRKAVVVSHHAPSLKSIDFRYKGNTLNPCYASNLEWMMVKYEPLLWIHGHTHHSFDYIVGKTRIICNPRGYWGYELNPEFNPELVIEV